MAIEIVMPRLGWTAEAGTLKAWMQPDGGRVEVGDVLFTVEGDKAVEEIEALDAGILHIPADSPPPGRSVPVGTLLAYILAEGERIPVATTTVPPAAGTAPVQADQGRVPVPDAPDRPGKRVPISPRARALATRLGVDWNSLKGSGRTGRIIERDIRAAAQATASISPVAQRLADSHNIDTATLQQAFPGQRISADMVRRLASEADTVTGDRIIPFSPVRQAIARHLADSVARAAAVTLNTEIDATELVRLRTQLKADQRKPVPAFNVLFIKILAHALQDHPYMNAHVAEDALHIRKQVHIGLAMDTERGLLVPVIRDVAARSLDQIQAEASLLQEKAAAGTLAPRDMQDGTFTLTNLGHWDVDAFTPILHAPQTGILGLGRIRSRPMAIDDARQEIAVRQALVLSLTFDHRAVDGAPAARFLQRIRKLAEQPYLWLTLQ